jgi:hypothetical protein
VFVIKSKDFSNYISYLHYCYIQRVFEMHVQTLTTSYWPHEELEKISKKLCQKIK